MNKNIELLLSIKDQIDQLEPLVISGKITKITGIIAECVGLNQFAKLGNVVSIFPNGRNVLAEIVGFGHNTVLIISYSNLEGVGPGDGVSLSKEISNSIAPHASWKGRIIDGFGKPLDEGGPLVSGHELYSLFGSPPNPHKRRPIGSKIDLGIRAIDSLITCCYGQRMGIFAGSGVGKSVLMSMITKFAKADIKIIGLIGERGREVKEFIDQYLGEEGLKDAIIIVATGDESALKRKRAAYLTMAIAEFFRDQGCEVLCIIDSITRFAMAQREIGLWVGEPPSSKGYTPTVFSELPKLLERAGPGTEIGGNITGLFTVLVEGDDQNEPIADAVRGIIDGHIVLERKIAERGRFPAINILKSISRAMPRCNSEDENQLIINTKKLLSLYSDMEDLIRMGAYKKGSNPDIDFAINIHPQLESFLTQKPSEYTYSNESFKILKQIIYQD